jgi:hypothetical protein
LYSDRVNLCRQPTTVSDGGLLHAEKSGLWPASQLTDVYIGSADRERC